MMNFISSVYCMFSLAHDRGKSMWIYLNVQKNLYLNCFKESIIWNSIMSLLFEVFVCTLECALFQFLFPRWHSCCATFSEFHSSMHKVINFTKVNFTKTPVCFAHHFTLSTNHSAWYVIRYLINIGRKFNEKLLIWNGIWLSLMFNNNYYHENLAYLYTIFIYHL